MASTYYAKKEPDDSFTIRQERYRGRNHPHDVMAVAMSIDELVKMGDQYLRGDVDYSDAIAADIVDEILRDHGAK